MFKVVCLETALASAFRESNDWGASEQVKQRYSCCDLVLWMPKIVFSKQFLAFRWVFVQ
jgi:hypothetical protein